MTTATHQDTDAERRRRKLLADIRRVVGSEIIAQRLMVRREDTRESYPFDDDAERQIIALAREGHTVEVEPSAWGRTLHQLVYVAIREAWKLGMEPSTHAVMMVLRDDGYSESIRPWVDELLDATPIAMTPGEALGRMRRVARRREMLDRVAVIDALLRCQGSDSADILRAIDALGRTARA